MGKKITKKIKNKIPKNTPYCYTPISTWKQFEDGKWGIETKTCPFYEHVNGLLGNCKLYDIEIMDQVKDCGINDYEPED